MIPRCRKREIFGPFDILFVKNEPPSVELERNLLSVRGLFKVRYRDRRKPNSLGLSNLENGECERDYEL